MMDFLYIGSTPHGEDCVQVGSDDYHNGKDRLECNIFKRYLERLFPLPEGANGYLAVKSFPHDFGSYREVVAYFDEKDEKAVGWAFKIEGNVPEKWDDQARKELREGAGIIR